jgi:hypothetical protein
MVIIMAAATVITASKVANVPKVVEIGGTQNSEIVDQFCFLCGSEVLACKGEQQIVRFLTMSSWKMC